MFRLLVLWPCLGLFAGDGASPRVQDAQTTARNLAEYNARLSKLPNSAEAYWRLASWCEQHGLEAEAKVHFADVTKLDPGREAAWKRLGFVKRGKRWVSPTQVAEEKAQAEADKVWQPKLKEWHHWIHDPDRRAEGEAELAKIDDPRAIPAVWRTLMSGGADCQVRAVQVFGQIKSESSSRALAALAIFGKTAEVRRRAAEVLRWRDPNEFIGPMIGLLRDPLKFQVKPVAEPGSPGVLFVEGGRFNVRQLYAPPPPPQFLLSPGDIIGEDPFGLPIVATNFTGTPRIASLIDYLIEIKKTLSDNLLEYYRAAVVAQSQLDADVAVLTAMNRAIDQSNERVLPVLCNIVGKNLGRDPKAWRDWLRQQQGFTRPTVERPKPTLDQFVPMVFTPLFREPFIEPG